MDKLKKVLSGNDGGNDGGNESGIVERVSEASTLTCGTRMTGFVVCFLLGFSCSFLGTCLLWMPGIGLAVFAVLYTVGNIFAIASTFFLIGPFRQLQTMCDKERAFATVFIVVRTNTHTSTVEEVDGEAAALMWCSEGLMPEEERVPAVCSEVSLVLTLCAALWWKNNGIALLFVFLQGLAFIWYSLSYIPFAREGCFKLFRLCL